MIARLRRQSEEEAKAGLQQFDDQLDAIGERLSEIDEKIENLNVTAADAAQKVAAVILITSL
jgi:tetrahydromethanopterin S-methyltransferase subunit G